MQRRRLTLQPVDGRLWLFALNDSDDAWNAAASVRRLTFDGVVVAGFQTPLNVPARSAVRVVEVESVVGSPSDPTGEVLVADAPLKRAWWFYRPDRELKYPRPLHDVHIERNASFCVLRLRARSLLRDVVFNADRLHAEWNTHEDHPVSLLPGESCEFHWSGQSPRDAADTAWETNLSGPPVLWCANHFGAGT
jgi:beta-mannosidase